MKKIASLLFSAILSIWIGSAQQTNHPYQNPSLPAETRAQDLVARLTLEEKAAQLQDVAPAIDRLGIPEYNWWNEALHGVARAGSATSFPQAIGMAASWNKELMYQVAEVISTEARAKYNHNLKLGQRNRYQGLTMWSPNINIFRDPRWGRGQESYGEDPHLTGQMAISFVKGLQGSDEEYFKVIATPKHYAVHSGPEHNRHSFDAYTDKRDLWETYLPAFEDAIVEAGAFSIMSAYNRYLGESATASKLLLDDILREKWGFRGYVVSDCGAVSDIYQYHKIVDTPEEAASLALQAGCDLNCGSTYRFLKKAVEKGLLDEKQIDQSLERLFVARFKLGLLDEIDPTPYATIGNKELESEEHQRLALQMARESMVLLKNKDQTLPLSKKTRKILVIGPNAHERNFSLGNYFGTPTYRSTILEGIKKKVGRKTEVAYFKGTNLTSSDSIFDVIDDQFFHKGVKGAYFNNKNFEGEPVLEKELDHIDFDLGGAGPGDGMTPGDFSIRYTAEIVADQEGLINIGVMEAGGSFSLFVNGNLHISGKGGNGTQAVSKPLSLNKGEKIKIQLDYSCSNPWMSSLQLVWNREDLIGKQAMMNAAAESDVIIFAGGITARLEGEEMPVAVDGFYKGDRTHLKLPKVQGELLKELHATGKPVVFLLTTGSAMAINWEQENLPAILNIWYPGQAAGDAVADILFGDYNPSGKLPLTFYRSVSDLPPFEDYHMKGRTYRYFSGEVLYPFGYGLSYSEVKIDLPVTNKKVYSKEDDVRLTVEVHNKSDQQAQEVIQVYVSDLEASVIKPIKSLKAFKKISLEPKSSQTVSFVLTPEDFSIFDDNGEAFVESGDFEIIVGQHSKASNAITITIND